MDGDGDLRTIGGQHLRYLLTVTLFDRGALTVIELVAAVHTAGFRVGGRPSKAVSDALRWEIGRGRVVRMGRGTYGPGTMPKQTASWIRQRLRRLAQPHGVLQPPPDLGPTDGPEQPIDRFDLTDW